MNGIIFFYSGDLERVPSVLLYPGKFSRTKGGNISGPTFIFQVLADNNYVRRADHINILYRLGI